MNITTAKQVVADSAGASGDSEMLTRAGRALDATAQRWNRIRWKFLLTEAPNYLIPANITVTGCTASANSTTLTSSSNFSTAGVAVDMLIAGGGLDAETLVGATGTTAITLAASATANASGTYTFIKHIYALPSDFKAVYDLRLLSNPRPLYYVQRRNYDRMITQQNVPSVPLAYDLYLTESAGSVRLIPPPSTAGNMKLRYFRRMAMPTAIATASGLDIPADYEDIMMACAKAYFLIDKEGPSSERAQYWDAYGRQGMKDMMNDQNVVPDEDLTFQPHYTHGYGGWGDPNSTQFLLDY